MSTLEWDVRSPFPLKHVVVYKWSFNEATTMAEIGRRLIQDHFYVVRPREDILVATSLAKPSAVIFVFIQREESGGDLVLVQTPIGPYTYDHLIGVTRVFGKIAGIKIAVTITRLEE